MFLKTIQSLVFIIACTFLSAQSPVGKWKTIDDKTGIEKSIIEIVEEDGVYRAIVSEILEEQYRGQNLLCEPCKGHKKNTPVVGLEIMWDMKKTGNNSWSGGKIMDPENGKTYGCKFSCKDQNTLKVRGFLGFAALGRNQYWHRVI